MSEAEGGYFNLQIRVEKIPAKLDPLEHFQDLLIATPYLDPQFRPEVNKAIPGNSEFQIKLLLQEESHLRELIDLIREWGYACEVIAN